MLFFQIETEVILFSGRESLPQFEGNNYRGYRNMDPETPRENREFQDCLYKLLVRRFGSYLVNT